MHGARHIEGVVRPVAPALEDDRLAVAHLPVVIGEHEVGEVFAAVFGAELQGLLRRHHRGTLLLHILAEAAGDLAPRPARPDNRDDLAQPGLIDLGAAAQERDLLRGLHLADVEPGVVAVDRAQLTEPSVHMMGKAQVVESDPRGLETKVGQGRGGAGDDVGLEVADHFVAVQPLHVGLQGVEPHRLGFPRHEGGVQELGDPHPGDPGRGLKEPGEGELGHHEGGGLRRVAGQDHSGLVLGEPPLRDPGPEPGGVVDIARQGGHQGLEPCGVHLPSGAFQIEQHRVTPTLY